MSARDAGRLAYLAFLGLATLDAAGYGVIAPIVPGISEATGTGPAVMGALVATFGIGMALGFWPAGAAIRRWNAALVLAVAVSLMGLGAAGFLGPESLPLYVVSRFLMGLGSGGLWMGITLGVMERWPGEEYRRLSGVLAVYSLGGIVGPALGAIGGIREPFLVYLGLVGLAVLSLRLVGVPHRHASPFGSDRAALRSPLFVASTAGVVLVSVTIGALDGVLPLHFASRLGQAGIAALYVGTSLVVAGSAVAASRFPIRATLAAAAALMTGGLALAGAGDAVWIWIVALAVTGVGFGFGETSSLGLLLEGIGPERMMLAMVVWSQVFALAYLVGPALGGVVAASLGYGAIGLVPLAAALAVYASMARLPRAAAPRRGRS